MATDASLWTGISAGSHGHPEMCHRPCVYMFKSGFCHLGSFCDHCHLHHEGPSLLKLDKKQRSKLKELSREDVMALLLPHIRHRVALHSLGPQTLELVQFLEAELPLPDPVISADLLPREMDRLNRVLSRLPFSALVAWLQWHRRKQSRSVLVPPACSGRGRERERDSDHVRVQKGSSH